MGLLIYMVSFMRSRITWEMSIWACLWGIISIKLIELGSWWNQSLGLGPELCKKEKAGLAQAFIPLCTKIVDTMRPVASHIHHCDFPHNDEL